MELYDTKPSFQFLRVNFRGTVFLSLSLRVLGRRGNHEGDESGSWIAIEIGEEICLGI